MQRLQQLSVRCFRALRRLHGRLVASPRWSRWVVAPPPVRTEGQAYREFNGWYFGHLDQQERMLADRPRMDFYHAAISRHIKPGHRVIDLGTGTGVLAAWAAHAGAAQVYALDHSAILDTARVVARANGIEKVDFVATHSADFTLPDRVDVILHEQMGDYLFDEGMVANVCDLRDRLLKPDGLILPSRFEWFCEPVRLREERRVPFIWELNVAGYDYGSLRDQEPEEPEYYRQASCDLGVVEAFLGEPEPAMRIDLQTVAATGPDRELRIQRTVTNPGRMDGLVVYFKVRVDDDLVLGSGPLDAARAPHWGFRILRTPAVEAAAGDQIVTTLRVGEWASPDTWNWTREVLRAEGASVPGR